MLSHSDNELLCRTGPGTPMGAVFRRFWNPIAMSDHAPAADATPVRLEILGEHLVLFRDSTGRLGLMDEACPHRGASLALGRVEAGGIRCLYHGWKFDCDGKVLEVPNHSDPRICERLKAVAYKVRGRRVRLGLHGAGRPRAGLPGLALPGLRAGTCAPRAAVRQRQLYAAARGRH
jgi:phthalate 4,5-dioxygenase oxygenase subunit